MKRPVTNLLMFAAMLPAWWCGFCHAETGVSTQPTPPIRIALMDLVCEDNSHRSTLAAVNFTTALQAELGGDAKHQWVERVELDKAESELNLAGYGLVDRAETIRSGRWAKADWAVFGRISTNTDRGRSISLEVVDLQRADVLAETNLLLVPQIEPVFHVAAVDVSNVLSTLRMELKEADRAFDASRGSVVVAMLFLSSTSMVEGLPHLDEDFWNALNAATTNGGRFRVIRFQRAGQAMDEANLVLSGLAESDPGSWQKVADQYIWGTYALNNRKYFDVQSRALKDDARVEAALNIWDGKGEPQVIKLALTNDISSPGVARQLAQAIEPYLVLHPGTVAKEGTRQRVSESLVAGVMGMPDQNALSYIGSPESRRQWFEVVQELETACFFDPGNIPARELWLRVRWGGPAAMASRNEFFFDRRRSAAWAAYVNQFGFRSVAPPIPGMGKQQSVTSAYVLSAWRPFEMFAYAEENRMAWGMPMDIGGNDLLAWEDQFGAEFVNRLLKAPEDPELQLRAEPFLEQSLRLRNPALRSKVIEKLWPLLIEKARKIHQRPFDAGSGHNLKVHFEEIGQPGGDEKLLAQLDAAARESVTNTPAAPIRLPRSAELQDHLTGDVFYVSPLAFPPLLTPPDLHAISIPPDNRMKRINSMLFHDDTLWLVVQVAEPLAINAVNKGMGNELQPILAEHSRLWKLNARQKKLEPVTGPLATNTVNTMLFREDTLWLALDDDGIAALNVKTGEFKRYETSAGVASTNQYALADTSRGLAAIGGMSDFLGLANGAETWLPFNPGLPRQSHYLGGGGRRLAGEKDQLLLFNSQLLRCDLRANLWTRIPDQAGGDEFAHVDSLAGDGQGGFWIVTRTGLHILKPDTVKLRSQWIAPSPTIQNHAPGGIPEAAQNMFHKSDMQLGQEIRRKLEQRRKAIAKRNDDSSSASSFVPRSRLTSGIWAVAPDGDFLWMLLGDSVLLYHPASHKYAGGFALNNLGQPLTFAAGGHQLWIATLSGADVALRTVDATTLQSTPDGRWIADEVSNEELSARLATLPGNERAVYEFFAGHDAEAIKLLHTGDEDTLDAQSLFLLAQAEQELGQAEEAKRFEGQLNERFPGGVFTQILHSPRDSGPNPPARGLQRPPPQNNHP